MSSISDVTCKSHKQISSAVSVLVSQIKLLSSVTIEECELPVLGIGSIEPLGIHFSQLNLQPRILNEL